MGFGVSKPLNVLWSVAPSAPLWGPGSGGPAPELAPSHSQHHTLKEEIYFSVWKRLSEFLGTLSSLIGLHDLFGWYSNRPSGHNHKVIWKLLFIFSLTDYALLSSLSVSGTIITSTIMSFLNNDQSFVLISFHYRTSAYIDKFKVIIIINIRYYHYCLSILMKSLSGGITLSIFICHYQVLSLIISHYWVLIRCSDS